MSGITEKIENLSELSFEKVKSSAPEWLRELKTHAWESYKSLSVNTQKEKFIDVIDSMELENLSIKENFSFDEKGTELQSFWGDVSGKAALNSDQEITLSDEMRSKGVLLKSLKSALVENEDLVRPHLIKSRITSNDSRFTSLAEAMWNDGTFLYVPKDTSVNVPIHLLKWINEGGVQNHYKTLIIVESGSKLVLIDESGSNTNDFFLENGITEIHVKDNAKLIKLHLQNFDYNCFNFSSQRTFIGKNATFKTLVASLGSQFSYENIKVSLIDEGGSAELLGVVLGEKEQVFQHETMQYHPEPNCYSNLHFETLLNEKSESAYNGRVDIENKAQLTSAHQLCRNLLFSKEAKAEAIPNLEVLADDVQCSHGVSIGKVDEEQLFYLLARGFDKKDAENLIIGGGIENLIQKLEEEDLGEKARDYILSKL